MSVYLIATSVITAVLVPPEAVEPGGEAYGRALAYVAHELLGDTFGTVYDISSILILWFAGASAMAGLVNIVPRYLPGYGMAPDWARAVRPVVLVYTAVSIIITILFRADVNAQAGAYATGILAMMVSAAFAVTISARRRRPAARRRRLRAGHPDLRVRAGRERDREAGRHHHLAGIHRRHRPHLAGVAAAAGDRAARRRHRLRPRRARCSSTAASTSGELHVIANKRQAGDLAEYRDKELEQRTLNPIPDSCPIVVPRDRCR